MSAATIPTVVFDEPAEFERLAANAGIALGTLRTRIADAAVRSLRFTPETIRIGRPVTIGLTDAIVAELHADAFTYIAKIRGGKTLSREKRAVADATRDMSRELRRFLLPPLHVATLARSGRLPDGVLEMALYEHGRTLRGWHAGLASWRDILLYSPRLLPESAAMLAEVWRTQSARNPVKRVPPSESVVYRDKLAKLARAAAPPRRPGGKRQPLDRYLRSVARAAALPDWVLSAKTRGAAMRRVLGDAPAVAVATGFMHGDLHGDNILLHFADDAPAGFAVIDLGTASPDGCAVFDWCKLVLDLMETQYSTPVFLEMPAAEAARTAALWCRELAWRLRGRPPSGRRLRTVEDASVEAALVLRRGLVPNAANADDLTQALFFNALLGLRYVSYRDCAPDDPSLVRNLALHAAAADAFRLACASPAEPFPAEPFPTERPPALPCELFKDRPDRQFRDAWLAGRRTMRYPAGAAGAYLRAVSPPGDIPRERRVRLLDCARRDAENAGDAFLADCCLLARTDLARNEDPDARLALLDDVLARARRETPRDTLLRGVARLHRGILSATQPGGDLDAGLADMKAACEILNRTPFRLEAARAMNSYGHYLLFRHDLAVGGLYLDEAWFARRPHDPPADAAFTLGCLATHARHLGDFVQALRFYQDDLAACDAASRLAVEQKATETRVALLAAERRRSPFPDPQLWDAAVSSVRARLADATVVGPFWEKCRLMAETFRLDAGLPADARCRRVAGNAEAYLKPFGDAPDYPASHVCRWLGRLRLALGDADAARRRFDAVAAFWRGGAAFSRGEALSAEMDVMTASDDADWRGLAERLHDFRRGLRIPPTLAWRLDPALRRLEAAIRLGRPPSLDTVREVQAHLEY